jgi:hypothetical protein
VSEKKRLGVVEAAGVELRRLHDNTELIDSKNWQKRENLSFRRFEVHGGYTGCEILSNGGAR